MFLGVNKAITFVFKNIKTTAHVVYVALYVYILHL